MTDLVEQLRQGIGDRGAAERLMDEAADEIESNIAREAIMVAVIERLRAALAGILEATDLDEVSVIARRALEPKL